MPPSLRVRTPDDAAIAAVVADVAAGFNRKDARRASRHLARDAQAIDAHGGLVEGREELERVAAARFAGDLAEQFARYELVDVGFVRDDVAIARVEVRATARDGHPIDVGHWLIATFVLAQEDGRWWIATRHDTIVRPARLSPRGPTTAPTSSLNSSPEISSSRRNTVSAPPK